MYSLISNAKMRMILRKNYLGDGQKDGSVSKGISPGLPTSLCSMSLTKRTEERIDSDKLFWDLQMHRTVCVSPHHTNTSRIHSYNSVGWKLRGKTAFDKYCSTLVNVRSADYCASLACTICISVCLWVYNTYTWKCIGQTRTISLCLIFQTKVVHAVLWCKRISSEESAHVFDSRFALLNCSGYSYII